MIWYQMKSCGFLIEAFYEVNRIQKAILAPLEIVLLSYNALTLFK